MLWFVRADRSCMPSYDRPFVRPVRRALHACVAVALLALISAPGAGAASFTMPLTEYGDIALDEANAQVFMSGGSSVAVRNLDGSSKAVIGGLQNAGGLVVDGSTLYVAQCGTSSIAVYDTTTLAAQPSISLGAYTPQGSQGNPSRPCGLIKVAAGSGSARARRGRASVP